MKEELKAFGFNFTYTLLDLTTDNAVIEYISIDQKLLDTILRFSKVSLLQYKIPKVWSQGDLLVYDNNQYVFHPSIKIEFQRLFSGVRKQLIDRELIS